MTWRDRDGELYDEPPSWMQPRPPDPARAHVYRPDSHDLSCDTCGLPRGHRRHLDRERTTA